jgi:hypothetical protein
MEWHAAVDGHIVAALREASGKLLGKSLESAVTGWYATRAQDGYAHVDSRAAKHDARAT